VFWAFGQLLEALLLQGQRERLRAILGRVAQKPDLAPALQRLIARNWRRARGLGRRARAAHGRDCPRVSLLERRGHARVAALLAGRARVAATFAACAYACAPLVLLAVPACGSIVGVLWVIVLTSIGLKVTHRISTGAAAAAVLAPYSCSAA